MAEEDEHETEGMIGLGTKLEMGSTDSPPEYAMIAELTNFTPPALQREMQDATHSQSPGGWREFIAGLKDGGEAQFEGNFIPGSATDKRLRAAQIETFKRSYRITWPNGAVWEFAGFVTAYEPEGPIEDKMTFSLTIKVTGRPALLDDASDGFY